MPQHLSKEPDMALESKVLEELAQRDPGSLLALPIEPQGARYAVEFVVHVFGGEAEALIVVCEPWYSNCISEVVSK